MSPYTIRLILDWLPFVIFIALFVFFLLRLRPQRQEFVNIQRAQLAEIQKANMVLERIAVALEKRSG